ASRFRTIEEIAEVPRLAFRIEEPQARRERAAVEEVPAGRVERLGEADELSANATRLSGLDASGVLGIGEDELLDAERIDLLAKVLRRIAFDLRIERIDRGQILARDGVRGPDLRFACDRWHRFAVLLRRVRGSRRGIRELDIRKAV